MSRLDLSRTRARWALGGGAAALLGAALFFLVPLVSDRAPAPRSTAQQNRTGGSALAPAGELPPPTIAGSEKSEALVRRYPFDSRVRYLRFLYYASRDEYEQAEMEIDMALASEDILNRRMKNAALPHRFVYAVFLQGRGRIDEARAVASPVCVTEELKFSPLRDQLAQAGLCG